MNNIFYKKDTLIILTLFFIMFIIKLFDVFFSPNHIYPGRIASFSWIEILAVFTLGYIGLAISRRIKLLEVFNEKESKKNTLLFPFLIGLGLGVVFISFDFVFKIGDINVGWPLSGPFYLWGAISQEIISHFFPVLLLTWGISALFFRNKYKNKIYWAIAFLLGLAGSIGMISAFNNPNIPLNESFNFVPYVIGLMVFIGELVIFKILKKYGLISAIFTRLGFYMIWHIIWPIVFY